MVQQVKNLPAMRETQGGVGKTPWRRAWRPTPVLLPGESHGQRSLVGHSPSGRKESDTTERLSPAQQILTVYQGRGNCLLIEIDVAFNDTDVTVLEDGQALVERTHEHICDDTEISSGPFLEGPREVLYLVGA